MLSRHHDPAPPIKSQCRRPRPGLMLVLLSTLTPNLFTALSIRDPVHCPQAVSRPQVWCQYPPSEAVEGVVEALEDERQGVARLQAAASVTGPTLVDLRLSGARCHSQPLPGLIRSRCPGHGRVVSGAGLNTDMRTLTTPAHFQ